MLCVWKKSAVLLWALTLRGAATWADPTRLSKRYKADQEPVAMCLPGHYRTFFNTEVVASNFASFEHIPNLKRFAVLSIDGDPRHYEKVTVVRDEHEQWAQDHREKLAKYDLAGLFIMDANSTFSAEFFRSGNCDRNGSCVGVDHLIFTKQHNEIHQPLCRSQADFETRGRTRESPANWAEQCWKVSHCGRLIEGYEAAHSMRFQWVVKYRPDFLALEPFPSLASFPRHLVWLNKYRSDHIFLCPRDLCDGFLKVASEKQLSCAAGYTMGFHSYCRIEFAGYPRTMIGHVTWDYALVRPAVDASSGIDCHARLPTCGTIAGLVAASEGAGAEAEGLLAAAVREVIVSQPIDSQRMPIPASAELL